MKSNNKSISATAVASSIASISKRNNNILGFVDGSSAVISAPEPEGKFCPFDR